ncbi:carboxymuconolactone decarboxylase family protein [Limobrevibacterium gyesilva]|uniref:Carboxymuconolactone decarboxylase family protein n=1 Tax=Limobrevibacterium gyesilva TaxID=2991712 RepID=A0AA42CIY0_9PROT|nr:carboxymuconolactone decarboxylase family protein [Limobrevibacterium gyesilva]MCW3476360.1 carboxymuconolactone decarboxylase family protein [Limobrevibacterium gyesilva]
MTTRQDAKGDGGDLPAGAGRFAARYPAIWQAYGQLGERCAMEGTLDARTRRLVKLALAIGAGLEGAVHSHVRRALREGIAKAELEQVMLLAVPSLGLPAAVRAMTWIDDLTGETDTER